MQMPPKIIPRSLTFDGWVMRHRKWHAAQPEVNDKNTPYWKWNHFFGLIHSRGVLIYIRDMCDVLVTSRPPFYLQIQQEFHFLSNSLIAVRITKFRVRVNDTFAWNHFDTFLFQTSLKIIRRDHIGGAAMIQWVLQFGQDIVSKSG